MRQPATTGRRKRGTPKRKTKRHYAVTKREIEVSGPTPLDYMLTVMRDPKAKPERRDEMAKTAASYVHPQLAPIAADVTRLVGQLLAEIAKSNAGAAEREA